MLIRINQSLPEEIRRRSEQLIAKCQAETLSQEEFEELLHLTDVVEDLQASRMDALAALAQSRGVSLGVLMADLGIPELSHD